MKLILNLLPAICFFVCYKYTGNNLIYATWALIISAVASFGLAFALYRKIERFQIALIILMLVFAIPTVLLDDPSFIKWKVSIVNLIMAIGLLICQFVFKTNIVKALSGIETPIPENLWKKATIFAALYLVFCAILNYFLAFQLTNIFSISETNAEEIWVNYKTYGNGILNFIFTMVIFSWIYSKLTDTQKTELEQLMDVVKSKNNSKLESHNGSNSDNKKE